MRLVYNQATIDGYIEAKLERLKRKIKNIWFLTIVMVKEIWFY
jgi:hypothetical protein